MSNILISKIQINEDVLELKDATARTNITALNQATNQNTTKITSLEETQQSNSATMESLNAKVNEVEQKINNSDHYNITVDSSTETLVFTK